MKSRIAPAIVRCFVGLGAVVALARGAGAQQTMEMPMNGALGISMDRLGSGTTWIPDAVRLPARHYMAGDWMLMVHAFVFPEYVWQQGKRGDSYVGVPNWAMLMADRALGGGHLQLRFMPSLDPLTVGRCGYPLLVQSGETCHGLPLVDRQHPHDFFKEIAALYERDITNRLAALLYAAPAGEPALGPVAFMHRPSAMDDPQAPLGHHWQDAQHISFGVVTAGLFTRTTRLELSAFNGIEPDEERWNIDLAPLRSFSGRVTVNPTRHWSVTAGYGVMELHERHAPHDDNGDGIPDHFFPVEKERRFVASAMYGTAIGMEGQLTATAILGRNAHAGESSYSGLLEAELVANRTHSVFGRLELTQKGPADLVVNSIAGPSNILAGSLGYVREIATGLGMTLGVGARGTVNVLPSALTADYGRRTPIGGVLYARLRPMPAAATMSHQH